MLNNVLQIRLRRDGFGWEAVALGLSQAFKRIAQFVVGVLVARLVGAEGRGIVAALAVPANLAVTFSEMGIRQAAALHIGAGHYSVARVQHTLLALVPLVSLVACATAWIYYDLVGVASGHPLLRVLALAAVPLSLTTSYASGVLLGRQRISEFRKANWRPVLVNLLVLLALGYGLQGGIGAVLIASASASLSSSLYALYVLSREEPIRLKFDPEVAWRLQRSGLSYAAALFVLMLNYRLILLLLTVLRPMSEVGLFAQALAVAELIWELPAAVNALVFSRGVNAREKQAFSAKVSVLGRLSLLVSTLAALAIGGTAELLFPIIYGKQFAASATICIALLPGAAVFVLFKVLSMDMAGRGRPEISLCVMLPTLLVNALIGWRLILAYGAIGGAVSTSLCFIIATLVYAGIYSRIVGCSLSSLLWPKANDFRQALDTLLHRREG